MQRLAGNVHAAVAAAPFTAPPVPVADDESPSIMDVAYGSDLAGNTRRFRRVMRIAKALAEDNFGPIWWRSEIPLRIAISTGLVSDAWANLTGEKGSSSR